MKYPPGSEWLYIRIYGGPQSLEEWMTGDFRELLALWRNSGLIRQFHFIHYLDPEYHLRLRFRLSNLLHSGIFLHLIQDTCKRMLELDLIWKIEVGTYEPEYERYGDERIHLVEQWFEIDSLFWLDEIYRRNKMEDPDIWKVALCSIHALLEDFGTGIEDKINIINRLTSYSTRQAGLTKTMRGQLDDKYRKLSVELSPLLSAMTGDIAFQLKNRSEKATSILKEISGTFSDTNALYESNFIPDLIHMSLNRAFRTRHRLQELVVYDFLGRYYESERARAKAGKMFT